MALENFEFAMRAVTAARILDFMRFKTASSRETGIQIQKLNRMLKKYDRDYPPQLVLGSGKKAASKNKGVARHRIGQQVKLVNKLVRKTFEENLRQHSPEATPSKTRTEVKKLIENINAQIYKMAVDNFHAFLQEKLGPQATIKSLKDAMKDSQK